MGRQGEIILYQLNETVWLNKQQLSILFDGDIKTIGKHLNNALKEELSDLATVAKFATIESIHFYIQWNNKEKSYYTSRMKR